MWNFPAPPSASSRAGGGISSENLSGLRGAGGAHRTFRRSASASETCKHTHWSPGSCSLKTCDRKSDTLTRFKNKKPQRNKKGRARPTPTADPVAPRPSLAPRMFQCTALCVRERVCVFSVCPSVHTCEHVYVHTCVPVCSCVRGYVCSCVCHTHTRHQHVSLCARTHVCACTQTCFVYVHTQACVPVYVHVDAMPVYACVSMCVCLHVPTH